MSRKLNLAALPERERCETIGEFLAVMDRHPDLAHVRAVVRSGPERQLALFAALERSVLVGSPAACPPHHDDASRPAPDGWSIRTDFEWDPIA